MTVDVLRNLSLGVPLLAVLGAVLAGRRGLLRLDRRVAAAAFLAALWVLLGVLVVESAIDLWAFAPTPTTILGIPVETALGWALVWGALPALVGGRPMLWLLLFAWLDLLLMPNLAPLVVLGEGWLWGEVLLLAVVAAPAVLLGRATRDRTHLTLRVGQQVTVFSLLVLWLVPSLAFATDGSGWHEVVDHHLVLRTLLVVGAVGCLVPAAAAVAELSRVGGGTPFPWDPPERLVVTGPYAYLANPMQAGVCAALGLLAVAAGSVTLLLGTIVAVVFSSAIAEPHERAVLGARWPEYADYRTHVRNWVPRWRPWVPQPATLWVSHSCGLCRSLGTGLERLGPHALDLRAAESAGVRLTRMRWVAGPGLPPDRGVAALARALEHVNVVAAWWGWAMRLPVVGAMLQVVLDACGLGPRDLTRANATKEQTSEQPGDPGRPDGRDRPARLA